MSLSRKLASLRLNVFDTAAAAYSMRIPGGSTYSDPLIRVRRSSDNAESDIHAVLTADSAGNRWLDTAALLAFVGAGNGFVTTWYDQSGNGRNAVQAAAGNQPRIVNAGVVDAMNGRPCVVSTTDTTGLSFSGGQVSSGVTLNAVGASTANQVNNNVVMGLGNGTNAIGTGVVIKFDQGPVFRATIFGVIDLPVAYVSLNTLYVGSATFTNGSSSDYLNGSLIGTFGYRLIAGQATATFCTRNAKVCEATLFRSSLNPTQRRTLERSQGTAFGVVVA